MFDLSCLSKYIYVDICGWSRYCLYVVNFGHSDKYVFILFNFICFKILHNSWYGIVTNSCNCSSSRSLKKCSFSSLDLNICELYLIFCLQYWVCNCMFKCVRCQHLPLLPNLCQFHYKTEGSSYILCFLYLYVFRTLVVQDCDMSCEDVGSYFYKLIYLFAHQVAIAWGLSMFRRKSTVFWAMTLLTISGLLALSKNPSLFSNRAWDHLW